MLSSQNISLQLLNYTLTEWVTLWALTLKLKLPGATSENRGEKDVGDTEVSLSLQSITGHPSHPSLHAGGHRAKKIS